MTWNLFIDDERNPMDVKWLSYDLTARYRNDDWLIARNIAEVSELICQFGMPSFISFDHDLGNNEPTGYDIAKELVEIDLNLNFKFPNNFDFAVHSKNPVGKANIEAYMRNYFKQRE